MRKVLTPLIILVVAIWSIGGLYSQQSAEDAKFQKIMDEYFDEMWKFYPTSATLAGYTKYDDKLEDLSSKNIDKRHDSLDKFNQEFVAKVDRQKLSPDLQEDHAMIVDALDRERLLHESLVPWGYNPIFYNGIFINSVRSLIQKETASLETRAKNVDERLKALPKLVKQAKENLQTPSDLYTQTAIIQFPAVLAFYKSELPPWVEQAPSSYKSKIQSDLAKAVSALEDYQGFLNNELLPRSTGNFRLGDAHRRLIQLTFQNNIPLEELIARAKADYNNIRREMFLVCIPFFKIMSPKFNVEQPPAALSEEQLKNTVIAHVLDKIKVEHVSKEEFLDKVKATADQLKAKLLDSQIVDLPEETPSIEALPLESQGISLTKLVSPGAYDTSGTYSCQIASFPDGTQEDKIQSLLEEYNNFFLPFWCIENVYPGQFVPASITRKNPSLVRRLYPNMPLLKGWSSLLVEKLINAGYGNYDLRLRLNQLKFQLRVVINFILDFNIHEGGMTQEQAVAYMVRGGFQTQAEADRNWKEIVLSPASAAYPYVGMQELMDMEKSYKQLKGESFDQKEFLKTVLGYGALHLRHLKTKILQ